MHLMLLICALISVAIAQNVFTTQACVTERGCGPFPTTSPAPPTTRSNTIHSTLTRVVSVCPTATVFVFNSTSTTTGTQTVNSTVVSALRVTQTSTTTTDVTTTDTEEATTTVTSTSTLTLTFIIRRTSTIPATSGFVPIASEPGYIPRHRNKRDDDSSVPTVRPALGKRCWPNIQAVVCNTTIFTLTARTVTQTGLCPTSVPTTTVTRNVTVNTATATVTATVVSTRTESTTVQATVENVITETTTSTWTWTTRPIDWNTTLYATTTLATATTYAACQANNLINSANGGHFVWQVNYGGSRNQIQVGIPARNAYECCIACHQTQNCIWSNFPGGCELVIANSCNPHDNFNSSFITSQDVRRGTTISNGPCGFIANGGDIRLI
ncbi:uncharacterized protein BKA55DRAFT_689661 [Fusarium redolens]|uniref:Apple domain-containing protein n=1 Tax=Fusarium redolens TaxID=48865 RepID=A0A9P9K9B8_FUSRE|nr:uncharacterized protein BKA55DRAFT_689661 [Fusarium redolens]KAH7254157.1 hypothetical protein BKA55DRAFT_689661 [Fusarium redolens]